MVVDLIVVFATCHLMHHRCDGLTLWSWGMAFVVRSPVLCILHHVRQRQRNLHYQIPGILHPGSLLIQDVAEWYAVMHDSSSQSGGVCHT